MSATWVDGVGLVHMAGGKSPAERDATLQYFLDTSPKMMDLSFFGNVDDALSRSIIYEEWLNRNAPTTILDSMLSQKKITEEEYKEALRTGQIKTKFPKFREGLEFLQPPETDAFDLDMASQEAHKRRWLERNMEEWGQYMGWTDSIALEKYYETLEKSGILDDDEKADKIANRTILDSIEDDMSLAYENTWLKGDGNFDVSDVQKKYGYDEEELDTLQSMKAAWDFAVENPQAMAGQIVGMGLADPELFLINFARIPAVVTRGAQAGQNLARVALNIKPKYYQSFEKMSRGQRVGYGTMGRGVEGAVYGGVYEGMRGLTMDGHINSQDVKTGAALGTLMGTAFGGITGNIGKDVSKNWMLNKTGSARVKEQFKIIKGQLGNLKFKEFKGTNGKNVRVLGWDAEWQGNLRNTMNAQQQKKSTTLPKKEKKVGERSNLFYRDLGAIGRPKNGGAVKVALPEGLDNISRGTLWRNNAIETLSEVVNTGRKESDQAPIGVIAEQIDNNIADRVISLAGELNSKGRPRYTMKESEGIAAKQEAKFQEFNLKEKIGQEAYDVRIKEAGNKRYFDKEWGTQRELDKVNDLRNARKSGQDFGGESVREPTDFKTVIDNFDKDKGARIITNANKFRAALVGGLIGSYISMDENDNFAFGTLMGMGLGVIARMYIPPLSRSKAALKNKVYQSANDVENITKEIQYKANSVMRTMEKVLKGKDSKLSSSKFIEYLEKWDNPKLMKERLALVKKNPEIGEAMNAYRNLMALVKELATEYNVLLDEQQVVDYVTHILRKPTRTSEDTIFKIVKQTGLKKESPFDNFRNHQKTISQIKKAGFDIEDDIFVILDSYIKSMTKAITGRAIIKELKTAKIVDGMDDIGLIINKGEKVANKASKELGYVQSNHPALKDSLIHPIINTAIDQFFVINKGGLADKLLAFNNTIKRANLAQSFFHAQALLMSGIYSGMWFDLASPSGIARMKKIHQMMQGEWNPNAVATDLKGNPLYKKGINGVIERDDKGVPIKMMGDYKHRGLVNELAETKMGIGQYKNNENLLPGYRGYKNILEKKFKIAGKDVQPLKVIDKSQGFIDKWTWDYLHDYSKIYSYLMMKERMMSSNPRGIGRFTMFADEWKGLSANDAKLAAAKFTDDAYGGQSMTRLAAEWSEIALKEADNPKGMLAAAGVALINPRTFKWGNLLAFSPDWTLSNMRIAFRGLGLGTKAIDKLVSSKGKAKLTNKEVAEINMYVGYTVRGLLATSFWAYVLHSQFAREGDKFDLAEFWKTGRLSMGGNEEWVISKQIAEPMHWILNPFHTGLSKASVVPKTILELFLGKEYVSMKQGHLTGPKLERGLNMDTSFWLTNKVAPIGFSPLMSYIREKVDKDYKGEKKMKDVGKKMFQSIIGFPSYYTDENLDVTK